MLLDLLLDFLLVDALLDFLLVDPLVEPLLDLRVTPLFGVLIICFFVVTLLDGLFVAVLAETASSSSFINSGRDDFLPGTDSS
jgi:hypothetical protein